MGPSPKNNRGVPNPGPMKLEVPKRCRPTEICGLQTFVMDFVKVDQQISGDQFPQFKYRNLKKTTRQNSLHDEYIFLRSAI